MTSKNMKEKVTHTILKDLFEIVKPWSDGYIKSESQDKTLLVPSTDGKKGILFEIISKENNHYNLKRLDDRPIVDLTGGVECLVEGIKTKGQVKYQPQYVEEYGLKE